MNSSKYLIMMCLLSASCLPMVAEPSHGAKSKTGIARERSAQEKIEAFKMKYQKLNDIFNTMMTMKSVAVSNTDLQALKTSFKLLKKEVRSFLDNYEKSFHQVNVKEFYAVQKPLALLLNLIDDQIHILNTFYINKR